MKYRAICTLAGACLVLGQPAAMAQLAPKAPSDKPVTVDSARVDKLERAIQPYIAQARASYPDAKKNFLSGLPHGDVFFVTVLLRDTGGHVEQVFVAVRAIKDGRIYGKVASDVSLVKGFHNGDPYDFPEIDLRDWSISKPDGSEEGNYVGKFLDTYRPE